MSDKGPVLKQRYTVVLLYPTDGWEPDMAENVLTVSIDAEGVKEAVKRAQLHIADEAGASFRPGDFLALAVFDGDQANKLYPDSIRS